MKQDELYHLKGYDAFGHPILETVSLQTDPVSMIGRDLQQWLLYNNVPIASDTFIQAVNLSVRNAIRFNEINKDAAPPKPAA